MGVFPALSGPMNRTVTKTSLDAVVYGFAFILAYWIRFDGKPPADYFQQVQFLLLLVIWIRLVTSYLFGVYRQVWSYVSLNDILTLGIATVVPSSVFILARLVLSSEQQIWRISLSIILIDWLLSFGGSTGVRLLARLWFERNESSPVNDLTQSVSHRILLVGAGMTGILVAKEARKQKNLNWNVVGFVDDDPHKLNTMIHGLKVIGQTSDIPNLAQKHSLDRVIITISNASSKDIRRIVETCEAIPIPVKIVPSMFEILDDKVEIKKLRDVNIVDLLGREVADFKGHSKNVKQYFYGKKVLITGAGGSIGSEICRQLHAFSPSELILLDNHENSLYEIDCELDAFQPKIIRKAEICDIRNTQRLSSLLHSYRPEIIFHAAANKHVPLLEHNNIEAVATNVQGTRTLLNLAEETDCERFVMLSTDKAVYPSSIMGACKRVAELMIQTSDSKKTSFSCVRFGNVLGSRGSVVPLFRSQIRRGGPLTITDRNATRFFMTIQEAAQLVIRATTLGSKGEIYVLDMGKPIKIFNLAQDMINLSGLSDDSIEICFTGLRPGEKLHEELVYPYEKVRPTTFPKIISVDPVEINYESFWQDLETFLEEYSLLPEDSFRKRLFHLASSPVSSDVAQVSRGPLRIIKN